MNLMNGVMTAVMEREHRVGKVEKTYEEIPDMLKVAALVETAPEEIKHMVFTTTDATNQDYDKLK